MSVFLAIPRTTGSDLFVFNLHPFLLAYLLALHVKLTKLILEIGCPSYHLTSWRKSSLIQKPSGQIPKAFMSM